MNKMIISIHNSQYSHYTSSTMLLCLQPIGKDLAKFRADLISGGGGVMLRRAAAITKKPLFLGPTRWYSLVDETNACPSCWTWWNRLMWLERSSTSNSMLYACSQFWFTNNIRCYHLSLNGISVLFKTFPSDVSVKHNKRIDTYLGIL